MRLVPAVALLIAGASLTQTSGKRADLDGVWILLRAQVGTLRLTPEGEKKRAAYDFQKDDPDFQCKPASFTRVMHTPSPPIEVRQRQDHVEVNYEFMDVHRRIPIKPGLAAKDAPFAAREYPHLGRSVGQYDGETLVVETAGQAAGVLDTLGVPGLYQSDQMRTVERFTPNGDRMQIVVTHYDPVYFEQPLTVTFSYLRLPGGKIETWDCKPEEATFERFLQDR
ncbi:MAG TPA: hypothetical protein VFR18_08785 [Terriglobia bacterium]|nr:hypothetical protein [Terriglobia bacterium]